MVAHGPHPFPASSSSCPEAPDGVRDNPPAASAGSFALHPAVDAEAWLEAHALDDDCLGDAYEATGARDRAELKLCIARLHEIYGESPAMERRARFFRQGFRLEEEEKPVPYLLIACEETLPFAAAFLAALMPALLAGVRRVLPCFVPAFRAAAGAEISSALLAALELAGVERGFSAAEEDLPSLARSLCEKFGPGRLLVLGAPPFGERLILSAHRAGVACVPLVLPPRAECPAREAAKKPESGCDRIPPAGGAAVPHPALFPDGEPQSVWIWPDLPPAWFRRRTMRIFSS
jgi:hypothetical protein